MLRLPPYKRLLLLTEGQLGVFTSKTAAVLLRHRPDDVVGVLDSSAAGCDLAEVIPWAPPVPIVADLAAAAKLGPDALVIGVAPVGGTLPPEMRQHVRAALEMGVDVVSGLHSFLSDDAELATIAARNSARIFDLRRPPAQRVIASARALSTRCRRVLTVGSDANVGKMVAALELATATRARGRDARFVATGQTGILVAGAGITIDACVADFAAGAAEQLVLEAADCDVCFVEGQGSLGHPGFSAVTLTLLHGVCPDAMVLIHQLGRDRHKALPHTPLPPLDRLIAAYERVAALLHPACVVGIALNTIGYPPEVAREASQRLEEELKLPVADPVRDGCQRLLDACGLQ